MTRTRISLSLGIAALAVGVGLTACGGENNGASSESLLGAATLQGIESGVVDLSLGIKAPGREGGDIDVSLSGYFQGEGNDLPQLNIEATAKGELGGDEIDLEGGVMLLPGRAYVSYEGIEYEVDGAMLGFAEQTLEQVQSEGGAEVGGAGLAGCQEEFGRLELGGLLGDGADEGGADIGGVATTKVGGELDTRAAIEALLEAVESPACRAPLAVAGPVPTERESEEAKEEVDRSVKSAQVAFYVGDDNIVRRISAQLTIVPKDDGGGPTKIAIDLNLTLTGVNERQNVSAPEEAKPLNKLLGKLGVNPIELLGLLQGEGAGEGLNELFAGLGLPDPSDSAG